ncbi:MAG: F0F1 ATP synthase subunit delta, partial [Planctomycetes bacterium]|nr:F0F1 ATP synthase subunit delta [Planctomycetota bacterium]
MQERVVAKRYARALLNLADEKNLLESVKQELRQLVELTVAVKDFARILKHPVLGAAKKFQFIQKTVGRQLKPLTVRFLELLVRKNRTECLPDIAEFYDALADEKQGIARVKVKTYYPLSRKVQESLTEKLTTFINKKVLLETEVDKNILGGIKIQVGDTVMDGSVANELNKIQEQLLAMN